MAGLQTNALVAVAERRKMMPDGARSHSNKGKRIERLKSIILIWDYMVYLNITQLVDGSTLMNVKKIPRNAQTTWRFLAASNLETACDARGTRE